MMSAPARMNPRWSERTLSGARRFASSGQRSRGTALETSVPMPPSPTKGGSSARRSRNLLTSAFQQFAPLLPRERRTPEASDLVRERLERFARSQLAHARSDHVPRSQAEQSTPYEGAIKHARVSPAAGESTTVRSLKTCGDAA